MAAWDTEHELSWTAAKESQKMDGEVLEGEVEHGWAVAVPACTWLPRALREL